MRDGKKRKRTAIAHAARFLEAVASGVVAAAIWYMIERFLSG